VCRADLEEFIEAQSQRSIDGVLANIGADGSEAQGVPAGIVVASPSRSDPDCKCLSDGGLLLLSCIVHPWVSF
jgi:hypothetical protein